MANYEKIFNSYCKNANEGVLYVKRSVDSYNVQYGVDLDKKFALGGITKLFTIACILNLITNKKLTMDSQLQTFLKEERLCVIKDVDYTKDIKLRDLLYQTSGIPDYFDAYVKPKYLKSDVKYSFSDKVNWVKSLKATNIPGKATNYSNANSDFLAHIVETASGKDLNSVYNEFIFSKLGFKNTYLPDSDVVTIPNIYIGGKPYKRPDLIISTKGSGGLVTTARELMKFLKAFFNGELFDKALLEKLKNFGAISTSYGPILYGGGLMKIKNKHEIIGHFGFTGAFAFCDIERDYYVCGYLATKSSSNTLTKMVTEIFDKG